MKNKKYFIAVITLAATVALTIFVVPRNNSACRGGSKKAQHPIGLKKNKDKGLKPTQWFTLSRAYPYDDIPFPAYKRALDKAEQIHNATPALLTGVWTQSGPTNVGGRVTSITASTTNPDIIYAGAALGGILKSTDAGVTWTAISDAVPSLSVGDIALDPSDPGKLYFGAGEANASGDSYAGTGVYRSTDAGATWQFLGLPNSRHIGKIAIDPSNGQRIFVAAMGTLFGANPDRGVYRTTDGGTTWERALYVSDSTGAADIAINPVDPNIIFASMWERIRKPTYRNVGGLTSGIWKSTDGGDTWNRLQGGLPAPAANIGRIGLTIAPSAPDTVYASYCDNPGNFIGFYRSIDGGATWTRRATDPGFSGFGWYFGKIWTHPTNANTVYFGDVGMWKSTNGGANWSDITGSMHVDQHAWWQDPANPNFVVCGNDGGVFVSHNAGGSWTKSYNLPITQFYAMTIDQLTPSRLYGGTQDNSTPRTWDGDPDNWDVLFYGDGFYAAVDPTNSNVIYAEAQYGYLGRATDGGNWFDIITNGIDGSERVNWCAPFIISPHNNQTLFFGAQKLYKTTNRGNMWNAVSPDLTGGPGGGNLVYGTITTISQSPLTPRVIWVGTDDSRVWVTTNGGGNWRNVSGELPDRWCTRVTADVFDSSTAYAAFTGYKIDELLPHIFKTTDNGSTWSDISGNLVDIPVNDILPDPEHPGRLFIGTDFGIYYTENNGEQWQVLGDNHPICPVFDIDLHNATRKLVTGTHGRSMYTYDLTQLDIGPPPCNYLPGDANGSNVFNGVDVVYSVNFLKGTGAAPPDSCDCPPHGFIYASADANGNCAFNGIDVSYVVNYFKGIGGSPFGCPDCVIRQ